MCLSPPPRIDGDGDISDGTDEIVGLKYLHERSRPIFTLVLAIANTIFIIESLSLLATLDAVELRSAVERLCLDSMISATAKSTDRRVDFFAISSRQIDAALDGTLLDTHF